MTQLNLDNLVAGFGYHSTRDLYKRRLMLSLMQVPAFVRLGPLALRTILNAGLPVRGLVKAMLFDTFCGGETVAEAAVLAGALAQRGVGAILDFAVEGAEGGDMLERTVAETHANISLAAKNPEIAACVLKFSGIAPLSLTIKQSADLPLDAKERQMWQGALARLDGLCAAASAAGVALMVDAEESWLQGAIDDALLAMMARYNTSRAVVYTTLQMYRHDRLAYLDELLEQAQQSGFHIGIKLVRGAYLEKERSRATKLGYPSPLYGTKPATDTAYDQALRFCVKHIERIHLCAGTHNRSSIALLARLMDDRHLVPGDKRISFAQLLGMGDILTYNLAASGFNTAKYIPYGPLAALVPYLSRRMEENSAMRGQTASELALVREEIQRRRK